MVIKGRSRSNGAQLADYLLRSKGNDRADVLEVRGTASPDSLKKSLLEMSMSSNLTKRGNKGLYHAQINPAIGEDRPMTPDDWIRAAEVLEDALGYTGQKRAIVLHEKNGRLHGHIVWERYDHDTGRLRTDSQNFKKHDHARAQIEQELGHDRTPQKREKEPTHVERLTELWQRNPDGRSFIEAAETEGYFVANGNDRRPFRVVTPDGQSLDLVRQLDGIKTKAVRDRLQPIRADLWEEAEALQLSKDQRSKAARTVEIEPDRSDNTKDLSNSQERFNALRYTIKYTIHPNNKPVEQSDNKARPPLPQQPEAEKIQSDKKPETSDLSETAATMLAAYRQRQSDQQERQRKVKEMQQQAAAQTKKQQEKSLTDQAEEMLQRFRQRQQERGQGRDGPEI